jgi:hypothetical protein
MGCTSLTTSRSIRSHRKRARLDHPIVSVAIEKEVLIVAKSSRLARVVAVLQKEESILAAQLGKMRDAIAALSDVPSDYRIRQGVRKAKTVARNVRKISAAQRQAVALRMKEYQAKRRKAK